MQQDQLVAAAVSDRVVTVEVIVAVAAVVDVVAVAARARRRSGSQLPSSAVS